MLKTREVKSDYVYKKLLEIKEDKSASKYKNLLETASTDPGTLSFAPRFPGIISILYSVTLSSKASCGSERTSGTCKRSFTMAAPSTLRSAP